MAAIRGGHRDVVKFLLERGGPSVITFADDLLETLLERNDEALLDVWWDEVVRVEKNPAEKGYMAALLNSEAGGGHIRSVDFLMGKGVPVDGATVTGETPLMQAVRGHHLEVVKRLIAKGADIEREAVAGGTILTLAAFDGGPGVLEAVLNAKPKLNRLTSEGETALTLVTRLAIDEAFERLLKEPGIDVNVADREGKTPLMHASEGGHERMVALLLAAGADRRRKDAAGHTAADLARADGLDSIVGLLSNSEEKRLAEAINPPTIVPLRDDEREFVLGLVEQWLVYGNSKPMRASFARSFYSATAGRYEHQRSETTVNSKESIRKLLDAPRTSECAASCLKLTDCIAPDDENSKGIVIRPFLVDSYVTQFVPAAKEYIGKDLIQVSISLKCGLAIGIVLTRGVSSQRILAIEYGVTD
jgi:uncharacterized protein